MSNVPNYIEPGGAVSVIGGEQRVASGGKLVVQTGGQIVPNSGTQAAAIANVATAGSATAAANATAINSILVALRGAGIIAAE
jgi:hypothetical protein